MALVVISNSGPTSLDISRSFAFNVEEYISTSKTFEWFVGEGPLFWWRIEWKPINVNCPPNTCSGTSVPEISVCSITPTDCDCSPPSFSGEQRNCEIWHMLATSINDLCARINKECCGRKPPGVFSKVYKYDRPALCCDVNKYLASGIPIKDKYVEVDFCVCECVNWVDPCDCGNIHVPCDEDTKRDCSPSAISEIMSEIPLFGLPKIMVASKPGFDISGLQVMKPQVDVIMTKCGMLPSNLKLKHNLGQCSVIKEFLARNQLKLQDQLDLVYGKTNDSWQKTIHFNGHNEKWTLLFEWACSNEFEAGNYNWKSQLHISRQIGTNKKQNTRILVGLSSHGTIDGRNLFGVNYNYNTVTNKVTTIQPVHVKMKNMHDEIGLFRGNWTKDPYLTFTVSVDKKG